MDTKRGWKSQLNAEKIWGSTRRCPNNRHEIDPRICELDCKNLLFSLLHLIWNSCVASIICNWHASPHSNSICFCLWLVHFRWVSAKFPLQWKCKEKYWAFGCRLFACTDSKVPVTKKINHKFKCDRSSAPFSTLAFPSADAVLVLGVDCGFNDKSLIDGKLSRPVSVSSDIVNSLSPCANMYDFSFSSMWLWRCQLAQWIIGRCEDPQDKTGTKQNRQKTRSKQDTRINCFYFNSLKQVT